jgi:hypothetical protein
MKVAKRVACVHLILGILLVARTARSEIVDRIVAVVHQSMLGAPAAAGKIITWSAAYEEARYRAFQTGKEPPLWSTASLNGSPQLRETVSQLVDQLLLEMELEHSPIAPSADEDVSDRMQEIANRYQDPETFRGELARYDLSEGWLTNRLRREKQLMEFVEFTLRPDVRLTEEQIVKYYESTLLPQLARNTQVTDPATGPPSIGEVREQIQEILIQQEIDGRLEEWLLRLRSSARISIRLQ